jgi:hypothetical protein
MNMIANEIVPYLIVLRYALLPKQVLAFDYGADKDVYDYIQFYKENTPKVLEVARNFLGLITGKSDLTQKSFNELCDIVNPFLLSLPFLDYDELKNFEQYNPFKDFDEKELYNYFMTKEHFPNYLDPKVDEASISNIDRFNHYYNWYNNLENKSLKSLLTNYIKKIEELAKSLS